jgi:hypothetical protein
MDYFTSEMLEVDGDPTLAGCEIQEESTLHLVQRLCGFGELEFLEETTIQQEGIILAHCYKRLQHQRNMHQHSILKPR